MQPRLNFGHACSFPVCPIRRNIARREHGACEEREIILFIFPVGADVTANPHDITFEKHYTQPFLLEFPQLESFFS